MPDNDDEAEANLTTPAPPPTDREAPTNPENEVPRRDAFKPPPPDSFRELAEQELVTMQKQLLQGLEELLGPQGRLAEQTAAISAVIDRAADRTNGTYELLRHELHKLGESLRAADSAHDRRLETLEREIAELRQKLNEQEMQLKETNRSIALVEERLNAARTAQATTTPAE
jgi:chromosome segregation ATPase